MTTKGAFIPEAGRLFVRVQYGLRPERSDGLNLSYPHQTKGVCQSIANLVDQKPLFGTTTYLEAGNGQESVHDGYRFTREYASDDHIAAVVRLKRLMKPDFEDWLTSLHERCPHLSGEEVERIIRIAREG